MGHISTLSALSIHPPPLANLYGNVVRVVSVHFPF